MKALKKLTNRGGKGQEGVGIIDGTVLTVQETVAVTIAKDVIDDIQRHARIPVNDITLQQAQQFAKGRTQGRLCTEHEVLTECARIINKACYGSSLARR